jgi:NAD(P)H-hydrate epimerase
MRRIDRLARERYGIPEIVLMEHAGTAVAQAVLNLKGRRRGSVAVFCGGGANGGDGFVAARHLDNAGVPVEILLFGDPARLGGAALENWRIVKRLKLPAFIIGSEAAWDRWKRRPARFTAAVDALLGTGFSGQVREPMRSAIEWLNGRRLPVVAVDVPSGLSADSGLPRPVAVRADVTVTCGIAKKGLLTRSGSAFRGRLIVADISLPRALKGD